MLSGVLDRFPDLRIILGHWGEVVLYYLERVNLSQPFAKLPRRFSEYARDQLCVGPSGICSERYLRWALDVLGPDRLVFSTDYPFEKTDGEPRRFLTGGPDRRRSRQVRRRELGSARGRCLLMIKQGGRACAHGPVDGGVIRCAHRGARDV